MTHPDAIAPDKIDEHLETILKAAGSSLCHYTPQSKEELRAAMGTILNDMKRMAETERADG